MTSTTDNVCFPRLASAARWARGRLAAALACLLLSVGPSACDSESGEADAQDVSDDAALDSAGNDADDGGSQDAQDASDESDARDADAADNGDSGDSGDEDVRDDADSESDTDTASDADGSGDTGPSDADPADSGDAALDLGDATSDADRACGDPVAEPYLELGTGVSEFVAWSDVDTAVLAEGIQGGFHVWGGLRGAGFSPEDPESNFSIVDAEGERIGALVSVRDFSCDEESGDWVSFGLTVFLDFAVWPPEVAGDTWELCVDTQTSDGGSFRDCETIEVSCCDWLFGAPPEDCGNGIDDEGDRLVDCDDEECVDDEACAESSE